jgi:hypothetical protein
MQLRKLKPDDVATVRLWYNAKGDNPVVDWLPDGSTFVCHIGDKLLGCGSLLLTNSGVVFMEYLATNNLESEFTQAKALRFLAIELEKIAKNLGYKVIIGLVPEDHFALVEFYKRQGALIGSKLMRTTFKFLS